MTDSAPQRAEAEFQVDGWDEAAHHEPDAGPERAREPQDLPGALHGSDVAEILTAQGPARAAPISRPNPSTPPWTAAPTRS